MVRLAEQDRWRWDRVLDRRGTRAGAGVPATQPARTVSAASGDRRRARRCPGCRGDRLVADRRGRPPAPPPAPERRRGDEPGDCHRRAARPRTTAWPRSADLDAERLEGYQPYLAARADLLSRAGVSSRHSPPTTADRADSERSRAALPHRGGARAQPGRSDTTYGRIQLVLPDERSGRELRREGQVGVRDAAAIHVAIPLRHGA